MLSDEQAAECKKGWALVCVDGYPAGWGKVNGAQVKNHYPKGLEIKYKENRKIFYLQNIEIVLK